MKIAIIGAGAIGGYVGVKLALAGEDVTFIVRGANLDGDPRQRHEAGHARRHRARGAQREGHQRLRRGRGAGHRGAGDEGPSGGSRRAGPAAAARAADRGRDDAERHPVLVLPRCRRRVRRHPGQKRRPDRSAQRDDPGQPDHRLRGLPGLRVDRAGRRQAHRGRSLPDRRARRPHHRARDAGVGVLHRMPVSRPRCSTTSAPRSGSSCGAT